MRVSEEISAGGLTYDVTLTGREHFVASFQVFWGVKLYCEGDMHANERRLVLYSFIMRYSTQCVKIISFEGKRQLSCFMHSLFSSISCSRRRRKMQLDSCFGFYILQRAGFIQSLQMLRPSSHASRVHTAVMGRDTSAASGWERVGWNDYDLNLFPGWLKHKYFLGHLII